LVSAAENLALAGMADLAAGINQKSTYAFFSLSWQQQCKKYNACICIFCVL
jgi:hypothetical protein